MEMNECPYCVYEKQFNDFCSRCGRPLSLVAKSTVHELKEDFNFIMLW